MSALMILSKPGKAYFLALSSFAMIPTNSALIDRVVDLFGALSGRSEAHPFSRVLTYLTREKVKAKAKKRLKHSSIWAALLWQEASTRGFEETAECNEGIHRVNVRPTSPVTGRSQCLWKLKKHKSYLEAHVRGLLTVEVFLECQAKPRHAKAFPKREELSTVLISSLRRFDASTPRDQPGRAFQLDGHVGASWKFRI
ncbi:uncharacterized protein RSE6_06845 [Rhynchosporium secalis]|uniref:Uncharacterized protein n=1 Tax=Rhynchosporium secalis TaxID=38038 RepID=A0A1E1MBE7_RHYSE|nr:uncharacterized protein RSE6_06845 [Rhynchosporium secalis]